MSRVPNFLSQSSEDAAVLTRAFCKIIRLIGTGAFGRVYLVDSGDQLSHAAKVMQKANFNKREWEAASRISRNMEKCPFVIRYDGIFEGEKSVIILMEFSNMPSLGNLIDASGKLPDERTVMIIVWDLKPDNILMHNPIGTTEVHMKISDFGLSRVLDDTLLAKTHCGTPLHMAPEVLLETGGFSVKADIWSVGVIMYQLLTKKHPFMSQTLQELMQKVRATPARPNNITDNCWNFIQGLLTFNAKDRLSAKQALRHAFFQPIRESALREEERHSVGINRSIVPLTATQIAHDAGRVNSQFNPAPLPEQDNVQDPLMSMSLVEMNEIMAKATQSLSYTPPLRRAIIDQLLKEDPSQVGAQTQILFTASESEHIQMPKVNPKPQAPPPELLPSPFQNQQQGQIQSNTKYLTQRQNANQAGPQALYPRHTKQKGQLQDNTNIIKDEEDDKYDTSNHDDKKSDKQIKEEDPKIECEVCGRVFRFSKLAQHIQHHFTKGETVQSNPRDNPSPQLINRLSNKHQHALGTSSDDNFQIPLNVSPQSNSHQSASYTSHSPQHHKSSTQIQSKFNTSPSLTPYSQIQQNNNNNTNTNYNPQYSSFPRRSSDPNERDKDLEQGWEFVDQSSVMPQVRNYKIIQNPPLTLPNKHQSVRQNELHQVPPIPPPPRQDD